MATRQDDVEPEFRRLGNPAPLHQIVQHEIRNYILKQGLRPGDPLKPESELARLFGVSRNSVREAVKALESTGVLETRRGSGVYIRDFSFTPLLDHLPYGLMQDQRALRELAALRKTLEAALITEAMQAMSPESVTALRETLETMRGLAEQGEGFAEQDRQFHQLLFRDLGNAMLLRLFDQFWLAFHAAVPPARGRTPMDAYHGHAAILDAILAGDPDQARTAVQDHYIGIESKLAADPPTEAPPTEMTTEPH
ncbi:FadR/GntR family transcriptional regulator [Phytohabitans sp. ZYX-F-186]|uniref:FadR/GntR family transcriptional regulator n=1 Tax=Phytohabitans maris TaxID=3071409 RepID=A0ABU0ZF72_9ACTN|nr:FadR/GntR family transcriptional regulator [Phytohabitans sp. ZYX-F-186]MDQ7905700.1 FadR/GntR family transcriptional regulator [Phytohabitans sp. ZYX-F-186]